MAFPIHADGGIGPWAVGPPAPLLEKAAVKIPCVSARPARIEVQLPKGRREHHARRQAAPVAGLG
jgi:hypothetical protein